MYHRLSCNHLHSNRVYNFNLERNKMKNKNELWHNIGIILIYLGVLMFVGITLYKCFITSISLFVFILGLIIVAIGIAICAINE